MFCFGICTLKNVCISYFHGFSFNLTGQDMGGNADKMKLKLKLK